MKSNKKDLIIEMTLKHIRVYHDKEFKKIEFEPLLTDIVSAVKEAIEYLKSINYEGAAILTFNDVKLKIRQYSYYQDKIDEYFEIRRYMVEKNIALDF